MICSKCGKEIKPIDAAYCSDCGACYCKECSSGRCETCFDRLKFYS